MSSERLYYWKSSIYYTGSFQIAVSRSFVFMKIVCTHLITESQGESINLILALARESDFWKNANDFVQTLTNLLQNPACERQMKGHFCPSFPFWREDVINPCCWDWRWTSECTERDLNVRAVIGSNQSRLLSSGPCEWIRPFTITEQKPPEGEVDPEGSLLHLLWASPAGISLLLWGIHAGCRSFPMVVK